jgi:flagellin FlaB
LRDASARRGRWWRVLRLDARGITGLETAIVLIAFVVVASVFAFTVLNTGVVATDKSRETVLGGLGETNANLILRGSVIGEGSPLPATLDVVVFHLANATQGGTGVNLSRSDNGAAIATYTDQNQTANLSPGSWLVTWLIGSGNVLDAGERVEVRITLTGLSTLLGASTTFKIEIRPSAGATLVIERATPPEIKAIMDLG